MNQGNVYLAVDLGAGSGRVLAGQFDGEKLSLQEIHRFPSETIERPDGWHWNFSALMAEIKKGIALALRRYGERVVSLGVDTWGVDYGLLDAEGKLRSQPFQYRDKRTEGMMEVACARMPKAEIYRRTGIQFMFFNTLFQLLAEARAPGKLLDRPGTLLFMPDLVNYVLTGRKANERSIASTGQLLNAGTRDWDFELLAKMGIPASIFAELTEAGTDLGGLLPELMGEVGSTRLRVIAVGSHDTASAVAGIPALEEEPVFLSSGTWSLMGRELRQPVLTEESCAEGFSNEGGVLGSTRFLKNISGMWLLQECKRIWDSQGLKIDFEELVRLARSEPPSPVRINPDAKEFQAPPDMPFTIAAYCRDRGPNIPESPGQFTRVILESLADKYAETKQALEKVTNKPVEKIHIVGGGSQNRFLNQLAANATRCEIVAGPVEATSLGNILMQMIAGGEIKTLREGREIVARSFAVKTFKPEMKE